MHVINESHFTVLFILSISPVYPYDTTLELKFCGFAQNCSKSNPRKTLPTTACCRPCECDDICIEKGTCCRDKNELFLKDNSVKQKCLKSAHAPNGIPIPSIVLSYYNRISCPNDFNGTDIKAKCEDDRVETLVDVTPVSSRDGKIIYKNKYCSYCHRERNIQSWEIIVHRVSPRSCMKILTEETFNIETITSKILSNCLLVFNPPNNIAFWEVLCFKEVTRRCNVTGTWEVFEKDIHSLCLNQTGKFENEYITNKIFNTSFEKRYFFRLAIMTHQNRNGYI